MAERFSYSQAGRSERGGPEWALDELFAPGSGYGYTRDQGKRRGQVRSEFIDPLGMLGKGDEKYGLTAWDDMFGGGGKINDMDALLRSLNFGNVVGAEGSRGYGGDSGSMNFGDVLGNPWDSSQFGNAAGEYRGRRGKHKPHSGDINYDENDPMQAWLKDISFKGKDRGKSWTGRNKADVEGYWYDPERLRFDLEDLNGIETLSDLDKWSQDNYGVDAQTLGAMSDELLGSRQEFADNPDMWWKNGALDVTGNIEGLNNVNMQLRLEDIQQEARKRQAQSENQQANDLLEQITSAATQGRHLGRNTYGQALGATGPEGLSVPGLLSQFQQQDVGYDYGVANAMQPYLEELMNAQFRYGG